MSSPPPREAHWPDGAIFTVGHSTLPIERFTALLDVYGIEQLADVRTVPRSRHNPQFNTDALAVSLATNHIAYVAMPTLGGLRHSRTVSPNGAWRNKSFRGYADYMQTSAFAAALDELLSASPQEQTAIMCAEAVPWRCHRSLVADALLVRNIPVEDIYYDAKGHSRRQPHKLISFARVKNGRLWYPAEDDLFAGLEP